MSILFRQLNISLLINFYREYLKPALQRKDRKNILICIYESLWLSSKIKYWPHNYFKYEGFQINKDVREIVNYIPGNLFDKFRDDVLNDKKSTNIVDNKFITNLILKWGGLSATNIHGRYLKNIGCYNDRNHFIGDLEIFLPSISNNFVVKPICGQGHGNGVKIIKIIEAYNNIYSIDGEKFALDEIIEYIKSLKFKELLFEEMVIQHPAQSKIYPHSVNTVRIDTLRSINGEVINGAAYLRMGRGGKEIDNVSAGGLAVEIELETGKFKKYGYDDYLQQYESHPDTNFVFESHKIPNWDHLKKLVVESAILFPGLNSIGWDVAVTANGPLIIEANSNYQLNGIQTICGPYKTKKEFMYSLSQHLRYSKYRNKYEKYFSY